MNRSKPCSFVWKYFEKSFENDKKYGICIFCKKRLSADAKTFRRHLAGSGCKSCPDDVRRSLKKYKYRSTQPARKTDPKEEEENLKIYICDCKFRTSSLRMWHEHNEECNFVREWRTWYRCDRCDFKTKHKTSLSRHISMQHTKSKSKSCNSNNILEKSKSYLHLERNTCPHCDYRAPKWVLKQHIVAKHVNLKYQQVLPSQFQLKYNRRDAVVFKRIFGNLHKCKKCPYFTKSLFFLKNHLKNHEAEVPFSCRDTVEEYFCGECQFTTNLITSFDHHIKVSHHKLAAKKEIVNKYKCSNCLYQTFSCLTLLKHQDSCTMEKHSETNLRFFDCVHCSYKAAYKCKFIVHMNAKHTAPEETKWFSCHQCDYKNKDKSNLKSHIRRVHTKRLTCEHCSYKTSYTDRLKRHINLKHKSAKEAQWFTCSICDFKTRVKSSLRQHVYTHVKKDRFQCKHCDYKTFKKAELNIHVINKHMSNEEIKWFNCDQCDYRAKHNRALKLHKLAKHTPEECINWLYCAHCDYRSKDKVCLKRHLKSKHSKI